MPELFIISILFFNLDIFLKEEISYYLRRYKKKAKTIVLREALQFQRVSNFFPHEFNEELNRWSHDISGGETSART